MPSLPRAPPLGKISPGRGKMAKPKRGTAGASAPERASPTEEKEKHSDTRTLTNRVSIAVSSRWSCSSYNLSVSHSLDSSPKGRARAWRGFPLTLFAKGSPFGGAGASAPERASQAEEKEKHSDTRTLTNRVPIAVFICSWETALPSQSRVARQLSQRESQGVESPLAINV